MPTKNRMAEYMKSPSSAHLGREGQQAMAGTAAAPAYSEWMVRNVKAPIERTICRFPGIALAVGLSAGVVLGCLVKRR